MSRGPVALLRRARYAFPGMAARVLPEAGTGFAARACARLGKRGLSATVGHFPANNRDPAEIVAACTTIAALLGRQAGDVLLAVKAPPLQFDEHRIAAIVAAADAAGVAMIFDSHGFGHTGQTLALVESLLPRWPGTGLALPARWQRSLTDADRFRDTTARIRVVKGEFAEPEADDGDLAARYLALVARLAGRSAPVGVATHDPALAERALEILRAAGTPCELEQLRGLPGRRTRALARRLGVPVRVYVPFGPGWWPYAIDKALARPYLPVWFLQDWLE